jgi:hypothetical protein
VGKTITSTLTQILHKNWLKMDHRLKYKTKTTKLLKENMRENFQCLRIGKDFFKKDTIARYHTMILWLHQSKNFYSPKNTI